MYNARSNSIAICVFVLMAFFTTVVTPGDWPGFRGRQRNAGSAETGLLQEWPSGGPTILWETSGAGRGYASLAIVAGRIYTLGDGPSSADDKDEYLLCFEQASG